MSDPDQKPDHSNVTPAPVSEAPETLKGKPPRPEKIVIVEDTQPGRAWTVVGTGIPTKPAPRKG